VVTRARRREAIVSVTAVRPERPAAGEFAPFYAGYVDAAHAAAGGDVLGLLQRQVADVRDAFAAFGDARAGHRYAPGKWSVREVAGHMADAERVFAYRAMRAARGDETPLPGFDENAWVAAAGFDGRHLGELVEDFVAVRASSVRLFAALDDAAWARRGTANGSAFTVRAMAYIVAGHAAHHLRVLRERYHQRPA
jgi:hypothetical protein